MEKLLHFFKYYHNTYINRLMVFKMFPQILLNKLVNWYKL